MAKIFYEQDCNLSLLEGKTIAIIGYGSPCKEFKGFRMPCHHWSLQRQQVLG